MLYCGNLFGHTAHHGEGARDSQGEVRGGEKEHLLLAHAGEAEAGDARLAAALAGIAHSLVEVSQRQVAVRVSGPDAGELLNSGCPLDLDPAAFPPGMCTRTLIGKAEAVLWRTAAAEYHLEVWRSFAGYVLDWLREASGSENRK